MFSKFFIILLLKPVKYKQFFIFDQEISWILKVIIFIQSFEGGYMQVGVLVVHIVLFWME